MIENIKARFKAKRFNIWTEEVDPKNKEGYFLYNGTIYFGNRGFVFFKSSQNSWYQSQNNFNNYSTLSQERS